MARDERAACGLGYEPAITDDDLPAEEHSVRVPTPPPSLVRTVVHVLVKLIGTQCPFLGGIEKYQIGIAADAKGALARVQAHQPGWRGGANVHHAP